MADLLELERRIRELERVESGLGGGSALPASAATGALFYRTDLGFLCYYDGTRWLTTNEYVMAAELTTFAATNNSALDHAFRGDFIPYITRVAVVTNAAATNNGSNYWTITVAGVNLAKGAADTIYSFTTAAHTAATFVQTDVGGGTLTTQLLTNRQYWRTACGITAGAPGALTIHTSIYYRFVVT